MRPAPSVFYPYYSRNERPCQCGRLLGGELYYQVQRLTKRSSYEPRVEQSCQTPNHRGGTYELQASYRRRAALYTKRLCGWTSLPGNRRTDWAKRQHGFTGDTSKLPPYVRHTDVLSAHSPEETPAASFLLPQEAYSGTKKLLHTSKKNSKRPGRRNRSPLPPRTLRWVTGWCWADSVQSLKILPMQRDLPAKSLPFMQALVK